jgi:hypothetical protein
MSTDNPAESEVSIESRLSAVFGADEAEQSEVAAEEPEQVTEDDATAEVQAEPEEAAPAEDIFEYEADDGTVLKLPAAVKEGVLRQQDYTKKAMQVAEMRKQAEDRLQFAEAREQITTAVLGEVTELRSLEAELKQYQNADWAALYDANPGQALRFQQTMRDLENKVATKKQEIQGKAQHLQQAAEKHNANQWQMAEQAARGMIGTITAAENQAMARTVEALGITPQEFKSRFADPRIIALTHKAAKWDALQAGKPKAVEAANKAPPVVKPGVSKGPGVASEQKYRDTRAALRKSGSVQDAAKLFLLRGT